MADTTAPPADPIIAAANQQKARSEAEAAAANARKAAIDAEKAAQQAAIGTFPDSGFAGKVDVKTEGGKGEATLLAARAAVQTAERIAAEIAGELKGKTVRIYIGAERPTLAHLQVFELKRTLLENAARPAGELDQKAVAALDAAGIEFDIAPVQIRAEFVAPVAAIALGLTTLVKVAGLFQSDYEVGGYAIAADDDLLGAAVAGALARKGADGPTEVYFDSRSVPVGDVEKLAKLLGPLAATSARAQERMAALKQKTEEAKNAAAAADIDEVRKQLLQAAVNACTEAAAGWQALATAYDGFIVTLTTGDDKSGYLISKVIQEQHLLDFIRDGQWVLFVRMSAAAGGYYIKRNLLSFLGGMPFFVTGGMVATYTLVSGTSGVVKLSGVVPWHSGYVRVDEVEQRVNAHPEAVDAKSAEQRHTG